MLFYTHLVFGLLIGAIILKVLDITNILSVPNSYVSWDASYNTTTMKAGQIISVTGITDGIEYRLILSYEPTGGILGIVIWTQ